MKSNLDIGDSHLSHDEMSSFQNQLHRKKTKNRNKRKTERTGIQNKEPEQQIANNRTTRPHGKLPTEHVKTKALALNTATLMRFVNVI